MATATESSSLYEQCSQAIREIFSRGGNPFTEIDVVNHVAKRSWGEQQYGRALNEAQQICATFFRGSRLKRYGPVRPPGQAHPDFLRRGRGGKMLYVGFDATRPVKTPNGSFRPIGYVDARKHEGLIRPGRTAGIDRDDFQPWGEQQIKRSKDTETLNPNGNGSDVTRLRANLDAATRDNEAKDREIERLRALLTERPDQTLLVEIPITTDLIEQMVEAILPQLEEALHSRSGA